MQNMKCEMYNVRFKI